MSRLATAISGSTREHQAAAVDWRHAAHITGIRRAPARTTAGDESPISP
ncbi:hypothetical protein [Nonomuraea sp. NPDC003754]